jgi:hypothetical protein
MRPKGIVGPVIVHRLKPDIEWREIEGEVVAVDLGLGRYVGINLSGALLWSMLQAGTTADAMVARLIKVYGIDEDVACRDVSSWLAWLAEHELLAA